MVEAPLGAAGDRLRSAANSAIRLSVKRRWGPLRPSAATTGRTGRRSGGDRRQALLALAVADRVALVAASSIHSRSR
jgi:hypothetical protein